MLEALMFGALFGLAGRLYRDRPARSLSKRTIGVRFLSDNSVPPFPAGGDKHIQAFAREVQELAAEAFGADAKVGAAQLQLIIAQAKLEGFGHWTGEMTGSHNYGSVQCSASENAHPDAHPWFVCVNHVDHHSDGTEYTTPFRFYKDWNPHDAEAWGVLGFLQHLGPKRRPLSFRALMAGDLHSFCDALKTEHYYEGFGKTREEQVASYESAMRKRVPEVAKALGENPISEERLA